MLEEAPAFSGFSVRDLAEAKQFYSEVLGVKVKEDDMGLHLQLFGGHEVFVYDKPDHQPATYTILNFVVKDIDAAVDGLTERGVKFEHYNNPQMPQDDKGILRGLEHQMGPDIAWFTDPSGNVLSVLQES